MEDINNIIYSVSVVCIFASYISLPFINTKFEKNVKYIISLLSIVCILMPLINKSSDFKKIFEIQNYKNTDIGDETNEYECIEYALKKVITDEFKINDSDFDIKIIIKNEEEKTIDSIKVEIYNGNIKNQSDKIKQYLYNITKCKIE